jgi:hypothetical protein
MAKVKELESHIQISTSKEHKRFAEGLANASEGIRDERRKFLSSLSVKYNLGEKWGFHPETGEVLKDEGEKVNEQEVPLG